MNDTVRPALETLFAGPGGGRPVAFRWRLVARRGRPFLLLPAEARRVPAGLQLYSAQRLRAKIWRRLLPAVFGSPFAGFFPAVRFDADSRSAFLRFLAEQAGVPAEQVAVGSVKFSEFGGRSRVVVLLCDESGRPARVVKAGLNGAGRAATEREADFLAQLPASKLGCIRLAGRFASPEVVAFATEYFPGTSPFDDAGLEHLFHDWLDTTAAVPLGGLPAFAALAAAADGGPDAEVWRRLRAALAAVPVRPTLYHGDFAPWNIRVVNARNLQAFDWERGSTRGVPGWDWFHFTVQTAILARRHPAARAAAEAEQLLHSPRFQKYAAAAGIGGCARPLLLAYLLHHILVTRPQEGDQAARELFALLENHWLEHPAPAAAPVPVPAPAGGVRAQLAGAVRQWNNLFWEPSLNSAVRPAWGAEFTRHWRHLLLGAALVAGIATVQYHANTHVIFLPFFVAVCALLAWQAGRRLGAAFAAVTAAVSPVLVALMEPEFRSPEIWLWNTVMRFIILELCVLFVDRIHKRRDFVHHRAPAGETAAGLADNWAVAALCGLALAVVTALDYVTDPHMTFLPLYLLPCMLAGLVFGFRAGIGAAVLASLASSWVEFATTKAIHYTAAEIFLWNLPMRFAITVLVLVLLDRIRRENILFFSDRAHG